VNRFFDGFIGASSSGKTQDFGSCIPGSNPGAPAKKRFAVHGS
jgi:hypothetical protein